MKVVFCSNYMNHHQLPFCKALLGIDGVEFTFVATEPVSEERKKFGYEEMDSAFPWIIRAYESKGEYARAEREILAADAVIFGHVPKGMPAARLNKGKLSFFAAERFLRNGISPLKALARYIIDPIRFNRKNCYLLCTGAYVAADYARFGGFKGKKYKWGYFPEVKRYADVDGLMKEKNPRSMLWAGRLLPLKHPEYALEVAKRLQAEGYDFTMRIVGGGELEEPLKAQIAEMQLQERVCLLGAIPAGQVRAEMEKSEIFLFTSDKNEGWGAVLSEAMNSACATVTSHTVGAAPFLVQDGENGFLFQDGDVDELYSKVKRLFGEDGLSVKMGKNAYATMINTWNPEHAARCFLALARQKLGEKSEPLTDVCSVAEPLTEGWYKG